MSARDEATLAAACPVCGSSALVEIVDLGDVPLFCNVQWDTRAHARNAASAPMRLAGCSCCGHHFNAAFDPSRVEYAPAYDTSQHHSATFRDYAEELARRLVGTYGLHGMAIVDIGCGKGDLLKLICRLGGNQGFGFDVSYDGDSNPADAPGVTFHKTFFDANQSADLTPDLVCCRHVLEHVSDPVGFLRSLIDALGPHRPQVLYFEVPNGELQLARGLIWDYIYEHFSYFSRVSLRRALETAGFEVLRLDAVFGDQFLSAEVRISNRVVATTSVGLPSASLSAMHDAGVAFATLLHGWRNWADGLSRDANDTVLWGAGSKGVTFVNLLELVAPVPIDRMIDQNPNKQGRYVARTGQVIAAPDQLLEQPARTVLLMNDIYRPEVSRWLLDHGLGARLISAMSSPPSVGG